MTDLFLRLKQMMLSFLSQVNASLQTELMRDEEAKNRIAHSSVLPSPKCVQGYKVSHNVYKSEQDEKNQNTRQQKCSQSTILPFKQLTSNS